MKYKVIVYYDNMPDSEHIFSNKNDAINELHRNQSFHNMWQIGMRNINII